MTTTTMTDDDHNKGKTTIRSGNDDGVDAESDDAGNGDDGGASLTRPTASDASICSKENDQYDRQCEEEDEQDVLRRMIVNSTSTVQ